MIAIVRYIRLRIAPGLTAPLHLDDIRQDHRPGLGFTVEEVLERFAHSPATNGPVRDNLGRFAVVLATYRKQNSNYRKQFQSPADSVLHYPRALNRRQTCPDTERKVKYTGPST